MNEELIDVLYIKLIMRIMNIQLSLSKISILKVK